MSQHCSHCNITWSDKTISDHSPQRGFTEEVIEVCPKCNSGLDLHPIVSSNTYSMSMTGKIVSDVTGKEYERVYKLPTATNRKPKYPPKSAWAEKIYNAFKHDTFNRY